MLIRAQADIKPSEITPKGVYLRRREFLRATLGAGLALGAGGLARRTRAEGSRKLAQVRKGPFRAEEPPTDYEDVTTYNNFYEFGSDKGDPARHAHALRTRPWSIAVEGVCARPGTYDLEDFIKPHALEERLYRLRCVEAWSMVIPWVGFPLADLLRRFEPAGSAKYVEFTTLYDPEQMPGQRRPVLDWPYLEGLRMDEAMHPLSFIAIGLYGEVLPNQNGAPLRLVVPWKYGFKSIKSIVRIRFTERQPVTAWMRASPREYGFYANVNPQVDHPRWSQKKERRIGEFFKRDTLMFNGYAEQVAHLYAGMDLAKHF